MKKFLAFSFFLFTIASLNAQTKLTKSSVLGKWTAASINVTGAFSYDIDKDSLVLGDAIKSQVTDNAQLDGMIKMMKSQLGVFTKMYFIFSSDGTLEEGGMDDAGKKTFTVNDDGTITTVDKDKKENTFKASLEGEKLKLVASQPQGEMTMILKKAK